MSEKDATYKWEQLEDRVNAVIATYMNDGEPHRFFLLWDAKEGEAMLYMDNRSPDIFRVPR
jgi:hypothetical protein